MNRRKMPEKKIFIWYRSLLKIHLFFSSNNSIVRLFYLFFLLLLLFFLVFRFGWWCSVISFIGCVGNEMEYLRIVAKIAKFFGREVDFPYEKNDLKWFQKPGLLIPNRISFSLTFFVLFFFIFLFPFLHFGYFLIWFRKRWRYLGGKIPISMPFT